MVNIFFENTETLDLNPEFFTSWLRQLCDHHKRRIGEINLILCSDDYLLNINNEYLNHDYYTDIITFDYTDGDVVSGDLFISVDRVKENSSTFFVEFSRELNRVVAHGTLHLIGFKDKTEGDQEEMRKQEDVALNMIVSRGTI